MSDLKPSLLALYPASVTQLLLEQQTGQVPLTPVPDLWVEKGPKSRQVGLQVYARSCSQIPRSYQTDGRFALRIFFCSPNRPEELTLRQLCLW